MEPSHDATVVGAIIAVATLLQTMLLRIMGKNDVQVASIKARSMPPQSLRQDEMRKAELREIVEEVIHELERRQKLTWSAPPEDSEPDPFRRP